jgi:hypothetical protein
MSEFIKTVHESNPTYPDLSNYSISIANRALDTTQLTRVDVLYSTTDSEIEFSEQVQAKVRQELSNGRIVTINNDTDGVVVGLQHEDEGLKIGVTKRYGGPHAILYDLLPQGEVTVTFDDAGRCKVALGEADEEELFSIVSPLSKKRSQDRFSIVSGRVGERTYISEEDFEKKVYKTSRFVTEVKPILVESLANNSEFWDPVNSEVRLGQWLVHS